MWAKCGSTLMCLIVCMHIVLVTFPPCLLMVKLADTLLNAVLPELMFQIKTLILEGQHVKIVW